MFIFKNKNTKEIRISTNFIAETYLDAWIWNNIEFNDDWDYGITEYCKHEKYFDIIDNSIIYYNDNLQRLVDEGELILTPHQKIENNAIVNKTDEELLQDNVISQEEYDIIVYNKQLAIKKTTYFYGYNYKITVEYEYVYTNYNWILMTITYAMDCKRIINFDEVPILVLCYSDEIPSNILTVIQNDSKFKIEKCE